MIARGTTVKVLRKGEHEGKLADVIWAFPNGSEDEPKAWAKVNVRTGQGATFVCFLYEELTEDLTEELAIIPVSNRGNAMNTKRKVWIVEVIEPTTRRYLKVRAVSIVERERVASAYKSRGYDVTTREVML